MEARVRQDDEASHVVAPLDDLHVQQRHLCHRSVNLPGVVAAIGPDQFEPGEAPSYLVEHQPGAVAILDRIGSPSVSTAFHLLAGVVTHLVVFTAPFSADFTDWLSRTAAEGLASRPIRSRSAICSSLFFSQIRQSPAIGPHARSRQLRAEKEGSLRNRPRLETLSPLSGTGSSNPSPSSGESDANLTNTRRKRRPTGRQGLPLEGGEDRHEPVHLIAVGRERHQHRGGDAGAPLLDPFADARRRAI
jgi:hypothetical protein